MITQPTIITERSLYLSTKVDTTSINGIIKDIHKISTAGNDMRKYCTVEQSLTYNPSPITLYIDSGGGSVYSMFALFDTIRSNSTPINTVVTGCAASAASVILVAGVKRFATPNSSIMLHSVSSWFIGGKVEELKDDVKEAERLNAVINSILADRTKIPVARLADKDRYKEDWWITATEALELGIIDEILK